MKTLFAITVGLALAGCGPLDENESETATAQTAQALGKATAATGTMVVQPSLSELLKLPQQLSNAPQAPGPKPAPGPR